MVIPAFRRGILRRLVGAFLLALIVACPAWAEYFVIERFQSDIHVAADAALEIVETIDVRFDSPRHGIYREIPIRYRTDFGDRLRTPIEITSVRNVSGKDWPTKIETSGDVLSIRIGDPDRYVDGLVTYVISYTVQNALLFHDDYDELYWNVTGNDWGVPIRAAGATVTLPGDVPAESLQVSCFAGRRSSNEAACRISTASEVQYELTRPLDTYEGLTIALGWPKGIVREPSWWQRLLWRYNLTHVWVLLLPLAVAAWMAHRWYHYGRDPEVRQAVTVMYEPPKCNGQHLSPAEVGAIIDERLDQRDITASIIDLAVRGYLKIDEVKEESLFGLITSTDYRLVRLKPSESDLSPFQVQLLNELFGTAGMVEVSSLKNRFYKKVSGLKSTLYADMIGKRLFPQNPETTRQKYAGFGIAFFVAGVLVTVWLQWLPPLLGILSFGLSGLIALAFANAMPSRTASGAVAHFEALGFREFMDKADRDKITRLGEQQNLFYKYLPYAIALDVADQWAKAFEGIFTQAPDWYVPHGGFARFSPYGFSRSLNTVTAGMASAMFSAPRGSGVGGRGGFSGGGFGGGGGRSW